MEEGPPPHETTLPRGITEEDILPLRHEIFASDFDWAQSMRGSLLGLGEGVLPSRSDIESSSRFRPRTASSKQDLPNVIMEHWLPVLRRKGLLVECSPSQFTTPVD